MGKTQYLREVRMVREQAQKTIHPTDAAYQCVLEVARSHAHLWHERDSLFWIRALREEMVELSISLGTVSGDPQEWELAQIASIAMNWLAKRHREGHALPDPAEMAARHGLLRKAALGPKEGE